MLDSIQGLIGQDYPANKSLLEFIDVALYNQVLSEDRLDIYGISTIL